MSHIVLLVNTSQIMKMKTYYAATLVEKLPPGSVFSARPINCAITAYKSGKVLFQGNHAEIEAAKWQERSEVAPSQKTNIICQNTSIFTACYYWHHVCCWLR